MLAAVLDKIASVTVQTREFLFRQGDPAKSIFAVDAGAISATANRW